MMKVYKLWAQVEEFDPATGDYQNITEDHEIGDETTSRTEAINRLNRMVDMDWEGGVLLRLSQRPRPPQEQRKHRYSIQKPKVRQAPQKPNLSLKGPL
jgi:hypothetical protein